MLYLFVKKQLQEDSFYATRSLVVETGMALWHALASPTLSHMAEPRLNYGTVCNHGLLVLLQLKV